jgi:hypothetical protein
LVATLAAALVGATLAAALVGATLAATLVRCLCGWSAPRRPCVGRAGTLAAVRARVGRGRHAGDDYGRTRAGRYGDEQRRHNATRSVAEPSWFSHSGDVPRGGRG